VLIAGNAAEAFDAVREHAGALHLLLTDVVLPDRNGL
jgi:YesN/AraC family two-component response regulator